MRSFPGRDVPPPPTAFGYRPPPEAIALAWICAGADCGRRGAGALVGAWPRSCPDCGHPVATHELADPWQHAARRVEIDVRLVRPRHSGDRVDAAAEDLRWHVVDALRQGRPELAEARRQRLDAFLTDREAAGSFDCGRHRRSVVREALEYHAVDLAARELASWYRCAAARSGSPDRRGATGELAEQLIAFLEQPGTIADGPAANEVWQLLTDLVTGLDGLPWADLRDRLDRLRRVRRAGPGRGWPPP
ncbi:hypothetical protein O7627_19510 [Solwaraspora sp. WMMD1047]|uniref:hypothetical protein n=1 Tax=Solwaraspora sp. WMMD1047 TaxID=3016102 RepID=UPI00241796ED|nr:hypothetical protein [Solwaraspora sp. WMMD1047]MDG4831489.1 hypothetical protein [Solwaraspora sp. WMMD1047]